MSMRGSIETYQKCPTCKGKFETRKEVAIICPQCSTQPTRFRIVWYDDTEHKTYRIASDTDGHLLDSYQRTHRLLEKMRKDVDDGLFSIKNYIKLEIDQFRGYSLFPRWLEGKKHQNLSPLHIEKIERCIEKYILPFFKDLNFRELKNLHIDNFFNSLPLHLSDKSKKNIMTNLHTFCTWLYRLEVIGRVPNFPVISPPDPAIRWIDRATQLNILSKIPDRDKPIFSFMIYHPVRPGEARALKVKDIDIGQRNVLICSAFSKGKIRPRKNKKPYHLPLWSGFNTSLLKDKLPEAFVFTNRFGRPYTHTRLIKKWKSATKKLGLTISLYNGTRHSIASQAINNGVDLNIISKALGHSTTEITKRYASMNIQALRIIIG
jgi:integrase